MSLSTQHSAEPTLVRDGRGSVDEGRPFGGDFKPHLDQLLAALDDDAVGGEPGPLAALDLLSQSVLKPLLDMAIAGSDQAALVRCLNVAVPAWIDKAHAGIQQDDSLLLAWRNRAGFALQRADDMVFGSKRRAEAAGLLVDFARGLAALAFQPGGVVLGGMVFCAEHSPGGAIATDGTDRCGHCPDERRAKRGVTP